MFRSLKNLIGLAWHGFLLSHLIFFPLFNFKEASTEKQKKRGGDYNFDQGTETKRKCSSIDINGLVMGPPLPASRLSRIFSKLIRS